MVNIPKDLATPPRSVSQQPGHRVAIVMHQGVVPLDLVVHMQIFGPWPNYLLADGAVANPYGVDLVGSDGESCGDWLVAHGIAALDTAATVVDSLLPAGQTQINQRHATLANPQGSRQKCGLRSIVAAKHQ